MGFPIKTSDTNWLEKALELFEKRTSISITDDANYNLNTESEVLKLFKRFTLPQTGFVFIGAFYVLAIVCAVLLYHSFSLQYAKIIGITLSIILLIVCAGIPTYYLVKNRAPKIEKTKTGIDIRFSKQILLIE